MSIISLNEAMVWHYEPPAWNKDRMIWDRLLCAAGENQYGIYVVRCDGFRCSKCVLRTNTDTDWRRCPTCGADVFNRDPVLHHNYKTCACGAVLNVCVAGIRGTTTPIIRPNMDDAI